MFGCEDSFTAEKNTSIHGMKKCLKRMCRMEYFQDKAICKSLKMDETENMRIKNRMPGPFYGDVGDRTDSQTDC